MVLFSDAETYTKPKGEFVKTNLGYLTHGYNL